MPPIRQSLAFLALIASAFALGPAAHAAITTHRCTQPSITVDESEKFATIELQRSHNLLEASVGYIDVYGSMQWLLPHGLHRIEFAPNEVRKTLTLPIADDVYSGTQTTTVRCGTMSGRKAGAAESELTLTVVDDEARPALTVPPLIEITESDEPQFIAIPVSIDGRFGRGGFVRVEAIDVTTTREDYRLDFPHVLFDRDETSKTLRLLIVGDDVAELGEELILRLSGDVAPQEIHVRIVDDDQPPYTLSFDQPAYSFREKSPARVTIRRAGDLSTFIRIELRQVFPDEVFRPYIPIDFAAGETGKSVDLTLWDGCFTGDRNGRFELLYGQGTLASADVFVADVDPMPKLSISAQSASEGDAGEQRLFSYKLGLSGPIGFRLPVTIVSTDGTANGNDYAAIDRTVTIPARRTSIELQATVHGDDDREEDEHFTIAITNAGPYATLGTARAAITIQNDDDGLPHPVYAFDDALPTEWSESQKWLTATVIRSQRTDIRSSATVTLHFNSSGRSFAPVNVDFEPNETRKDARFFIDDSFYSSVTRGGLSLDTPRRHLDSASVLLYENEPRPVVMIHDLEVTETAAEQGEAFIVSVDPPMGESIGLDVGLQHETTSGDIRDVPARILIPAFSSGQIPVTIVPDTLAENDETFRVSISAATNGAPYTIGRAIAVGTIHDDDGGAHFTFASDYIRRGTTAAITLELDAPAPASALIPLVSSAPHALTVPANVEIAAGSRTATFEVSGPRSGAATLLATLPPWLGERQARAELIVFNLSLPLLPDGVTVRLGETITVPVSLTPPADVEVRLVLETLDLRIAAADHSVVIPQGGTGTFLIYATKPGTTLISIRLLDTLGGTVVHLPVEVVP